MSCPNVVSGRSHPNQTPSSLTSTDREPPPFLLLASILFLSWSTRSLMSEPSTRSCVIAPGAITSRKYLWFFGS